AERDRARGDDGEVAAAGGETGEVGGKRIEPGRLQPLAVDEERGADLDDDPAKGIELGGHGRSERALFRLKRDPTAFKIQSPQRPNISHEDVVRFGEFFTFPFRILEERELHYVSHRYSERFRPSRRDLVRFIAPNTEALLSPGATLASPTADQQLRLHFRAARLPLPPPAPCSGRRSSPQGWPGGSSGGPCRRPRPTRRREGEAASRPPWRPP